MYIAVIEREDGTTYEQPYCDIHELEELVEVLGESYRIVSIY